LVSLCLDLLGLSCMALARSSGQVWWCGELSEGVHGRCVACMPPLHHSRLLAFFNLRSKRNWLNRGEIKISSGVVKPNADFGRFQMKIKLKSDSKSNTKSARTQPTKSTLKTPIDNNYRVRVCHHAISSMLPPKMACPRRFIHAAGPCSSTS
jgi:hypothetical protein